MKPIKAVITAANPLERYLPLQTITDSHGDTKTALQIILDELFTAGLESVAVIIVPGAQDDYLRAAGPYGDKLVFIEQADPLGYGHAVWMARDYVGADPFVLLVGDHLYLSQTDQPCIEQVLDVASQHEGCVSAVQSTHESRLNLYGTVGVTRVYGSENCFEVQTVVEKPTPTRAEQDLIVPGLRHGNYLCFFGVHVLNGKVMDLLDEKVSALAAGDTLGLTETLAEVAASERYLAFQIDGTRFNLGRRYGLLRAEIGMALAGPHRDEILTSLINLLAVNK
ncbi:MAG: UTP--glucose-1-phosphate uridylyltransferase [Verrucomicrobiae bacterium]|nr:UTP--glucose-1-phosphate uridylyltransferase [Verrucomicrobiae bacterium]NNJ41727.1 UTP--glucose-1-phosphate uridylyltransferase [Akkermansiaceae bacterium]